MKTCSGDWRSCSHACFGSSCYVSCGYEGYCDFQLPRDSREQPKIKVEMVTKEVK